MFENFIKLESYIREMYSDYRPGLYKHVGIITRVLVRETGLEMDKKW